MAKKKILLCGESYIWYTTHLKGADVMTTQGYKENVGPFKASLEKTYDVTYMPSHVALYSFPDTVEKLSEYDAVIFSDIGSNTLQQTPSSFPGGIPAPNRLQALHDYVLQGGAFMMIGGFMSFTGIEGKARYGMTEIADIFPVELLPFDDRIEASQGIVPVISDKAHPVASELDVEWPYVIGYNKTVANPDLGEVIATVNGDPLIAVGKFGKGRTAVYTSDCCPHWCPPVFLDWEGYDKIWVNLIEWLTE